MKDYNAIIKQITEAVEQIKDQHIKETAFARLLEDALNPTLSPSSSISTSPSPSLSVIPSSSPFFEKTKIARTTNKAGSVRAPYNISIVRDEVKEVFREVHAKLPGVRPYNTLKQKMHKYLWVLEVARQQGIDSLTNSEIAFVLDVCFREGVADRNVTNLVAYTRNGYVQRRELENGLTAWRILSDGIKVVSDEATEISN